MKPRLEIFLDTLGVCNLKCPSCPTGRRQKPTFSTDRISPGTLQQILGKATREANVYRVNLFNWTDSLLHPELSRLIWIVRTEFGLKCRLSSNLNHAPGIDQILREPPDELIVSLSGYTQGVYSQTHTGGDIEAVKAHMVRLSSAMRWDLWPTKVTVAWHRYKSNLHEETAMREFCQRLGFTFAPVWAVLMPVEAVVDGAELPIIDNLVLSPKQGIEAGQWWPRLTCYNRNHHLVLDSAGNASLCCPGFDLDRFGVGNFLEQPLSEIQQRKNEHSFCRSCQNTGVLAYLQGAWPVRRAARKAAEALAMSE